MGAVFCAFDRLTGQTVALKQVLIRSELPNMGSIAPDVTLSSLRMILTKEFQILAGLRHPNIISVLDYGFDSEKKPYYTMNYLEESQTILQAGEALSFEEKIELIIQLLQGLAYLHRRGVLHRDIKPDNVLVVDGTVKLLDFGLSQGSDEAGDMSGSPQYMAPEVIEGEEISLATDLYAVGVLFYQLIKGQHPFGRFDTGFYNRLMTIDPDWSSIDPQIHEILKSLLARDPAERTSSAYETLHSLKKILGHSTFSETEEIRESYLQAATFVGREKEVAQFKDGLREAKNERGVVYLLGGESGVGKSRLLDEFRTQALVDGWQVLNGQEIAEQGTPYQLWRDIVARVALNSEISDLEAGVLQEIVPSLGTLLEREIPPTPSLSGSEGEQRLILTLVSVLQRQNNPSLIILEDLHWSKEGLAPLKQILKILDQLPRVMVIGSYRHDERPGLPQELPTARLIQLNRLNNHEVAQLSEAMLGTISRQSDLVSLLTKETEGNTFFIVEVMRALAEDAGQMLDIGTTGLPTEVFTSGMEALLQRRINKVAEDDRPLLQMAAVAGRQLDLQVLTHLAADSDLSSWLQRVANATILVVRDGQWSFSHDKLRQAAMAQLTTNQLKESHRQIATAIEHVHENKPEFYSTLLAHWQAAEDIEKELAYLLPVTNRMIEITGDFDQGLELISRGLTLLTSADPRRIELLNQQANIDARRANYAESEKVSQEAYQLAKTFNNDAGLATSLNIMGYICIEQSRYSEAKEYLQQALSIAQAAGLIKKTTDSLIELGVVAEFQKDYAVAEEYFLQSLSLRESIDDQVGVLTCNFYLGMLKAQYYNDFEGSLEYSLKNLEINLALGNQRNIAKTYTSMGIDYASLGKYETAHGYFQQSLALKETFGDPPGVAHTYMVLGELCFFEGVDYELSLQHLTRAMEVYLQTNSLAMIGIAYGYIALIHIKLGDFQESLKTAIGHFELQSTLELDKSNGLVHAAVAGVLAAAQVGQISLADLDEKMAHLETFTQLAPTPIAYLEEAVRVSTIAQIRMVVLMECGEVAINIGQFELATQYLSEAKEMAEKVRNSHKMGQIEAIFSQMTEPQI